MTPLRTFTLVVLLEICTAPAMFAADNRAPALGLSAGPNATVVKDGRPYRGVGVNYFDCFLRTLGKADDTSYDAGFATLAARKIPFARFAATGFWPRDMQLYLTNRSEYFRRMDGVVSSARKYGIGLIPSLFWYYACVPDLVGESMDQWAQPDSKTQACMREYVREVVTRYRDNPAIWAWEFGNEYSLQGNLPNAKEHRAAIHPSLGTARSRSERDDLTFDMIRAAYIAFAREVRKHDAHRLVITGDAFLRPSAWHQERENKWTRDTPEQFAEMLAKMNPDPINAISVHAYDDADAQRIAGAMTVARNTNKPLFVGEFGAPGETAEQGSKVRRLLDAIVEQQVPLSALWVYDFGSQKDFSVTATNARAWQLTLITDANERMRRESTKAR